MKYLLSSLLVIAAGGLVLFGPAADAETTIIIKAGSFTLSDDRQSLSGGGPPVGLTFDEDASGVFGVEGELLVSDKVTIGGELFIYENDWDSDIGTSGEVDTLAVMLNAKRYFGIGRLVQFYVGAGIGLASIDFEGPGGSASGDDFALQAMGGVTVRRGRVGAYSELKWFSSEPEDVFGEDIDVSGTGLFAGLSFGF